MTIVIGVGINRDLIAAFLKVTDPIVVAIQIAAVVNPIAIGIDDRRQIQNEVIGADGTVGSDGPDGCGWCLRNPVHYLGSVTSTCSIASDEELAAARYMLIAVLQRPVEIVYSSIKRFDAVKPDAVGIKIRAMQSSDKHWHCARNGKRDRIAGRR